jgi:hypothetical protein
MRTKPHPLVGQILGVYQLLVGGYGALMFTYHIVRAGGVSLGGLVFVAMYVLVAYAGFALLKGRANGARLTVIAQALQVVRISSGSLAYAFVAGLAFWINVGSAGLQVPGFSFGTWFRWMTASGFGTRVEAEPFTVGINLVAALILVYFLYGRSGASRRRR